MKFYLVSEGVIKEPILLGETSFKKFWPDDGLAIFTSMIQESPELLGIVNIKDSSGHIWNPVAFIDHLNDNYDIVLRGDESVKKSIYYKK